MRTTIVILEKIHELSSISHFGHYQENSFKKTILQPPCTWILLTAKRAERGDSSSLLLPRSLSLEYFPPYRSLVTLQTRVLLWWCYIPLHISFPLFSLQFTQSISARLSTPVPMTMLSFTLGSCRLRPLYFSIC